MAAMPRSRSRPICSFAGELARPSLTVERGSTEARIFTVSRYMSRVFEDAAIVTPIKGSNHAGPEVSALP
jgi:hypothetical protein